MIDDIIIYISQHTNTIGYLALRCTNKHHCKILPKKACKLSQLYDEKRAMFEEFSVDFVADRYAMYGNIDKLDTYLPFLTKNSFIYAAAYNQVDCLRYLHENCRTRNSKRRRKIYERDCMFEALINGSYECVKYLHSIGVRSYYCRYIPITQNNIRCYDFLRQNDKNVCDLSSHMYFDFI